MGVYNNNKDGTRSTLANTIQVVDAPMEQFVSRGEFSAVTPNDVSADNKLVAENEVTKAYDTMPSTEELLAMPNGTVFYTKNFYTTYDGGFGSGNSTGDGAGGYYMISTNAVKNSRRYTDGTTTKYLVAIEDNGWNNEYVNLTRLGVRAMNSDYETLTTENTFATMNSDIIDAIQFNDATSEGSTWYLPKGHFYFERPLDLSTYQRHLVGEQAPYAFKEIMRAYSSSYSRRKYSLGTTLFFPFLENGQAGVISNDGNVKNITIVGGFGDNYDFNIDRTSDVVLNHPEQVVTEVIKQVDGADYKTIGLKKTGGGFIENVHVMGFYTGIKTQASNVYLTNLFTRKCHFGYDIAHDAKCSNLYGWNVHTGIRVSGALISVNQMRVDSCVHLIMAIDNVTGCTFTDCNGDWCTDSLVQVGDGTTWTWLQNCTFLGLHGRSNTLKYYDNTTETAPKGSEMTTSNSDGYGMFRFIARAGMKNNYIQCNVNRAKCFDVGDSSSLAKYVLPSILVTYGASVQGYNYNQFVINDSAVEDSTQYVRDLVQTSASSPFIYRIDTTFGSYQIKQSICTKQTGDSSLTDLTDTDISSPQSGDVLVYDGEKWENGVVNTPKNNLFVVAHRGLSTNEIPENTIAAFKNAIRDGYSWIEIDVRRTQDYVYVLAHDASMTLYKNGVAETVDFANTPYSQLLDYTWDAAGNYHVDTLDNTLFALKNMNVNVIIDNKVGGDYHIEMIREARQYGMCDRCVVSVSLANLTTYLDEIKPFPDARLRIIDVTDATQFKQVASEITNDIYLDMHAEMAGHWDTRLPLLLSLGYPIIAAGYNKGASHNTYRKHVINCVAGIMSDQNITYRDFVDTINNDLDVVASMITSPQRVALTDEAVTLNAQNAETGAGYINMYSTDDSIASVVCTQRGESATSTITPVNDGMCELYVFNPSITNKIPCVVADSGAVGIIGDIGDDGTTFNNTSTKLSYCGIDGDSVIKTINRLMRNYYSGKGYYGDFYLMEIPEGATRFTANVDTTIEDTYLFVKFFDSAKTRVLSSTWSQTKDITIESNYKYIAIGCRIGSGTTPLRQNDIANEYYDKVVSSVSFAFE